MDKNIFNKYLISETLISVDFERKNINFSDIFIKKYIEKYVSIFAKNLYEMTSSYPRN